MAELRRRRDQVADADLVELRLDTVADPSAAGALADRRTPVIVTCRPRWEGGHFAGSEEERKRILHDAVALGAEHVDVEWRAQFTDVIGRTKGRGIVVSMHDFDGRPRDLADQIRAMRATGSQYVKASVTAHRLDDCVALLDLARESRDDDASLVLVAMGERGVATRVLASRFKSPWSYAGEIGSVGQLTPSMLLDEYRFRSIREETTVYGVVGSPVGHSVSPAMHNAAIAATGRDAVYLPLDAADADDFVAFATRLPLAGASVTIPYKTTLRARVDDCSETAQRIGAINTVKIQRGRWVGENTDAAGFIDPLRDHLGGTATRVSILGAGGSARAAVVALASAGARVTVHARDQQRARTVAAIGSAAVGPWPPAPRSWDVLVNCTPIGMYPYTDASPVAASHLTGSVVYDLVYNPTPTRLLREAAAAGCRTIGGLEMLIAQAEQQFEWWFGSRPPAGVMRAAAVRRLKTFGVEAEAGEAGAGIAR